MWSFDEAHAREMTRLAAAWRTTSIPCRKPGIEVAHSILIGHNNYGAWHHGTDIHPTWVIRGHPWENNWLKSIPYKDDYIIIVNNYHCSSLSLTSHIIRFLRFDCVMISEELYSFQSLISDINWRLRSLLCIVCGHYILVAQLLDFFYCNLSKRSAIGFVTWKVEPHLLTLQL